MLKPITFFFKLPVFLCAYVSHFNHFLSDALQHAKEYHQPICRSVVCSICWSKISLSSVSTASATALQNCSNHSPVTGDNLPRPHWKSARVPSPCTCAWPIRLKWSLFQSNQRGFLEKKLYIGLYGGVSRLHLLGKFLWFPVKWSRLQSRKIGVLSWSATDPLAQMLTSASNAAKTDQAVLMDTYMV